MFTKISKYINVKNMVVFIIIPFIILAFLLFSYVIYENIKYYITGELFKVNQITVSYNATTAPNNGSIGIWKGSGNINDDESDYYIVHDNTYYGRLLLKAKIGDTFIIKDKKYKIYNIIYVIRETTLDEVKIQALPRGDSATMQVCVPNSNNYKILIAN